MKRGHIIALALIVIGVIALYNVFGDMSPYSSFEQSAKNPDRSVKVVGVLSKDKEIVYNPEKDANYFSFYMKDEAGEERKCILNQAKPTDFARSEKIVLTGKTNSNGDFIASHILLKCPSKYKDEEIQIRGKSSSTGPSVKASSNY